LSTHTLPGANCDLLRVRRLEMTARTKVTSAEGFREAAVACCSPNQVPADGRPLCGWPGSGHASTPPAPPSVTER
jgi:hypothetical protein